MKETKIRYSKQRELILSNLKNRHDHPTAEMIYQDLKIDYPNLSLGTVYRNLNQLYQTKQINRLDLGGPMVRFDGKIEPHMHFICDNCGKIYDIENNEDTIKNQLQKINKHKIKTIHIKMTGICQECLSKKAA